MNTGVLDLRPQASTEGFAAIRNIMLLDELVTTLLGAAAHLPRIGVFSGPSGFGKSFAAAFAAGEHRAYYVEVRSNWTRRALLLAILRQQGITPATTIYDMVDQVAEQLALSQRPLIVDECDHVVARGLVETVRDVFEQSQAPIVLIGEERLPQKLAAFERFHGRILAWRQAAPCSLEDAKELARF
jgi:DNA transposition AAA+ family ATPase